MATIAILGAGLGGVLAAYEVKAGVRPADRVVLISKGGTYHFVPSNPWVAVHWRERSAIEVNLPPVMKRKGIEFVSTGAKRVHPGQNRVELSDGSSLAYDYLVIAIGSITVRNVQGSVAEPGRLHVTLLGMSFIGRLSRAEMKDGMLVLQE